VRDVDCLIVGAGVIGAATAWRLSRSGRSVVLLEQFEVGHTRGSSHGASRIFRFSYDDPAYVAMAMEAVPLWRELEARTGRAVLTVTGGLDWGKDLEAHTSALSACGATFELMDGAETTRRFPLFAPPPGEPVLYQGDAGVLAAEPAWRSLVQEAAGARVELRERARVLELRVNHDHGEARTEGEVFRARAVVVTAGGWAKDLLAGVGIDLPVQVSRQTVAYFPAGESAIFPVAVEWGESSVFYALPSPGTGMKVGEHHVRTLADPDDEGVPDPGWVAGLEHWVADRVPGARPKAIHAETCLYTSTSDERFILERHGPIVVGSACSGHAFKFAPLIGGRLADLALEVIN
jgi:sarcosine oxidase